MQNLHEDLMKKEGLYAKWHSHPKHHFVQWIVLLVVIGSAFWLVYDRVSNPSEETYSQQGLANNSGLENGKGLTQKISSNTLLVKIKSSARSSVKPGSPENSGLSSLAKINRTVPIKTFKRVAKSNPKAKTSSDLFGWYVVVLDTPGHMAEVKFEQKQGSFQEVDEKRITPNFTKLQSVFDALKNDPKVQAVEPNYLMQTSVAPNDPYYSSTGTWGKTYPDLWGIHKIQAEGAWQVSTGTKINVIVADIDTGVDYNHPDLVGNMWVNKNEIPSNGIDDDANGYVDDYKGWDFHSNDNDPMDDQGHGTHTAGTIGAVGNNALGVVGVNWQTLIMPLKFLDNAGSGYLENGMLALQYAADNGAWVSSNSWGCSCNSLAMDDAIKYQHDRDMVVVVAAGNSNADAFVFSPASSENAITVAASDSNDLRAYFSNYGLRIDVAAPGVDVLSTRASQDTICAPRGVVVGEKYCYISGTSMATPHVAGLATLLLAKNPNLHTEEIRQIIRTSSNDLGTVGQDSDFGFGRINAKNALEAALTQPLTPYISSPRTRATISGTSVAISGSIGGPDFASYKLEMGFGRNPSSWALIKNSTVQPNLNSVLATFDSSAFAEGEYIIRLTAFSNSGSRYYFQVGDVLVDNFETQITYPSYYVKKGSVSLQGTAATKGGTIFGSYKIEASPLYSNNWTVIASGSQPVTNSNLGIWNTSSITDGSEYLLRLTVFAANGSFEQSQKTFLVDSTLVDGWPKTIDASKNMYEQPVIGDLLGDGQQQIVVTTINQDYSSMQITAYRHDGSILNGFPINITNSNIFSRTTSRITLADINGDGKKEILVTYNNNANNTNKLLIYGGNGQPFPGWTPPNSFGGSIFVKDMNADGVKDVVTFSTQYDYTTTLYTFTLSAFDQAGNMLNGFPRTASYVWNQQLWISPISIHDLDNDGKIEIAFGIDDKVYLLDDRLQLVSGWPYTLPPAGDPGFLRVVDMNQNLTSADFYGDGKRQLFLTNNLQCGVSNGQFQYFCHLGVHSMAIALNKNGTSLSGFPKVGNTEGYYVGGSSMAHADVNNDGADDALVLSQPLLVINKNNSTKISSPLFGSLYGQNPVLADVDGDGQIDAVVEGSGKIGVLNLSGQAIWSRPFNYGLVGPQHVLLADMDGDRKLELIAPTNYYRDYNGKQNWSQQITIWHLNLGNTSNYDWPMFGQNINRDNNIGLTLSPTDTEPPSVSVINPTASSTVSSTVSVNVSATDNVSVAKVEIYVDNVLKKVVSSSPYTYLWDTKTETNGIHNLQVMAYDSAGNKTTVLVIVVVQNILPNTPAISLAPTSLSFSGVSGGPQPAAKNVVLTNSGTAQLNWSASPDQAWCYVTPSSGTLPVGGSVSLIVTVGAPSNVGNFTCNLSFNDPSASNNPQNLVINYNVTAVTDTQPPTVSITSPNNNFTVERRSTLNIVASSADNVGVTKVEFYVNGNLSCTDTSYEYSCSWKAPAAKKTYTLQAKAYDLAGNIGSSTLVNIVVK